MPRRPPPLDSKRLIAVALVLLVIVLVRLLEPPPAATPPPPAEGGYLLTSWNVENLHDDTDDPKDHDAGEDWFAADPAAVRLKLKLLSDELLALNGGRGPDILAIVEVENRRAVELLRDALNARLSEDLRYTQIVHHDNISGRRIEPALITRLPVDPAGTKSDFDGRRIIQARLVVDGRPLTVIVGHWTSRVTDRDGGKRLAYGRAMYGAYLAVDRATPGPADVVLCGDFNDEPTDNSVILGLRATGDASAVLGSADADQPRLLDLLSGRDPETYGTYYYGKDWQIYDQIVVSPGLLDDRGWAVVPDSVRAERTGGTPTPARFGDRDNTKPRGPSDHEPVSVRLVLPGDAAAEPAAVAE